MSERAPRLQTPVGRQVHARGYAMLEQPFPPEDVAAIRAAVTAKYAALGSPPTFANPPKEPAPDAEIARVGFIFHKLGVHAPELAARLLTPELVAVARDVLGDDMYLEYTCAVLCNDSRPFFPWHMHVGGVDNVVYRKRGQFPSFDRCERLSVLLYLDDLTDDSGPLLVYPRVLGGSTRAPYDPALERWDDQVELRCKRGSVVLLDQCTWHAAAAKHSRGLRSFIAYYFTAQTAPAPSWVDHSFDAAALAIPLLASVLPRVAAARTLADD